MAEKFLLLACFCMSLQGLLASDFPVDNVFKSKKEKASDSGYRLPGHFNVNDYKLTLTPHFDTNDDNAFTFDGHVVISGTPGDSIDKITMHARNLTIRSNEVAVIDEDNQLAALNDVNPIEFNEKYDFFTIHLKLAMDSRKNYTITINFKGIMHDDMSGFYKSSYKQDGVEKWMGTTQFQPVHARKVFPCFDEPKYKATFTITIIRPDDFSPTLSNMPIDPSKTRAVASNKTSETFFPTPKMSTYLVAFIVSEYVPAQQTTDKKFGIWARPQASTMGNYSFVTGQKLLATMDDFTQIKYYDMNPNMKMDQAAIPDFSAGAMENWGLLTYREASLMIDEKESSARFRQAANSILAHEIAHMWFGDLVTCDWWSVTWLNEGFARYFQYRLPDMVEDVEMMTQFPVAQMQTAFQVDTSINSVPLTHDGVNSPGEIGLHFGSITYNKGASVIRMMQHLMGEDAFKDGLTRHLNSGKSGTVLPEHLFSALQNASNAASSLQNYPGATIEDIMGSWTRQAGYPLVTVNIDHDNGAMNISQERFVREGETAPDVIYKIPITFATKSNAMFNDTKPQFILAGKSELKYKEKGHEWVVFNKQQTGYYRINYDDHSWMTLASALMSPERTSIHTLNRAQIVDDVFNLAREKTLNYTMMFNIIQFLQNETDYAPWTAAYAGFSYLRQRLINVPTALNTLEKHISTLMTVLVNKLKLAEDASDSHLTKLFRASTLTLACQLGHEGCIKSSMDLFDKQRLEQVSINPNLREHVYCNALRHGNESHFTYLWNKYSTENVVNEQIVILGALGCTNSSEDIMTYLNHTITQDSWIRKQDVMTAFNAVLTGNPNNIDHVFKFVQNNWTNMKKHYTSANLQTAFSNMAYRMKPKKREALLEFLRENKAEMTTSEFESGITAVINAGQADLWGYEVSREIEDWMAKKYSSGAGANAIVSVTLLLASLFMLFNRN